MDLAEKLSEMSKNATPGKWGQFSQSTGPFMKEATSMPWKEYIQHHDTSHHMSTLNPAGEPYRLGQFKHANDAAFAETLVNAYRSGRLLVMGEPK